MDIAKSFFSSRDHEGYVGKDEHTVSYHKIYIRSNMLEKKS